MKKNQYFMYGILVSFNSYLDTKTNQTLDDVLRDDNDLQGIFTGRNGDFMIIGRILETVENHDEPLVVPELRDNEMIHVKSMVNKKYGIYGEFHYYFITNTK